MASTANTSGPATLGVAIVTYRSANVIAACLDSLLASRDARLRVVICDNASPDNTREVIRQWAADHDEVRFAERDVADGVPEPGATDRPWLTLLRSPVNGGFAYGTNRALEHLLADQELALFWVLNPDARARADTAARYLEAGADGDFALMGGRTLFEDRPDIVQTDGGRVSRWTGRCVSVNWGERASDFAVPAANTLDYITGANCIASRGFIEEAGLMPEDYFLFYEEVEWALRRGRRPLRIAPDAVVHHYGGSSIGSANYQRRPSAMTRYFTARNRMRFVGRVKPLAWPVALAFNLAKAVQVVMQGDVAGAGAMLRGTLGAGPPPKVRALFDAPARLHAFGERE